MKKMLGILLLLMAATPVLADRVVVLPELAAGRYYLTIVTSDTPTPADADLLTFMGGSPNMASLKEQVVYHEWVDSTPIVQQTAWKTYLGTTRPAVLLQATADDDGRAPVVFFATGDAVQTATLAQDLQDAINKFVAKHTHAVGQPCPDGRCPYPVLPRVPLPRPAPYPQPNPQPAVPTTPATPPPAVTPIVPTVVPPAKPEDPKPEGKNPIPIWLFALPLIGAGAGLWKSFEHN
jgi:hypothetical protein